MPDIKAALTRQIGPLPVYAWGAIGIGGFLIVRQLSGGAGDGGQVLGRVTDADPFAEDGGSGSGSGDGATHNPVGSGGTGTVGGNGTSYQTLKITGSTPVYAASNLSKIVQTFLPTKQTGTYIVNRVTLGGKQWYKITGKIGAGGIIQRDIPARGYLIPFKASPTTYTIQRTTATQAAA